MGHLGLAKLCTAAVAMLSCNSGDASFQRHPAQSQQPAEEPKQPATVSYAAPKSIVEIAQRIASMESLANPDPNEVAKLAGGGAIIPTESPSSVEVKTVFDGVRLLVHRGKVPEVSIHSQLSTGLQLKNLSAVFGAPETVMESKTSHVMFEFVQHAKPVSVFVHLFTPHAVETSPVLSLSIRSGNGAAE